MFLLFLSCIFAQEIDAKTYTSITDCTNEGSGYQTPGHCSEIELGPLCPDPNNPSNCPLVCCGTQASKNLLDCKAAGGNYLGQCGLGQEVTRIGGRGCCANAYTSDSCTGLNGVIRPVSPGCNTNTEGSQIGKVCPNRNDNPASCNVVCCRMNGTNIDESSKLTDTACQQKGNNTGGCTAPGGNCLSPDEVNQGQCTDGAGSLPAQRVRQCCVPVTKPCSEKNGECKTESESNGCERIPNTVCENEKPICCKKTTDNTQLGTTTQDECQKNSGQCLVYQNLQNGNCPANLPVMFGKCETSEMKYCCTPRGTSPKSEIIPTQSDTSTSSFAYNSLEALPGQRNTTDLPTYLLALYNFGLGAVGIAALLMAIVGGYFYVTSAGNTSRVSKGKELITDAILGIVVAFCAWLLLYIINPDLVRVNLESLSTLQIKETQKNSNTSPQQ